MKTVCIPPSPPHTHNNRILRSVVLVTFLILSIFYFLYHKKIFINSDHTTMVPLVRDFMNGNILLKDWVVGTNSFFFTESIFCIPFLLLGINSVDTISITASVIFAGAIALNIYYLILTEMKYASVKYRITASVVYIFCVGVVSYPLAAIFLNLNSHNGLYVYMPFALYSVLRYRKSHSPQYLFTVFLLGLLMQISDGLTLTILFAPVIVYEGYVAFWHKEERKYSLFMSAVIFMDFLCAKVFIHFVTMAGGLEVRGFPISFQSPLEIFMRIEDFILLIQEMYGVNTGGNVLYHVVSIIVMIGVFLAIFYQFIKVIQGEITNISLLLWIIIVGNFFSCIATNVAAVYRYIGPFYVYGLLLLIHTVMEFCGERMSDIKQKHHSKLFAAGLILCICVVVVTRVQFIIKNDVPNQDTREIAEYIEQNNLGNGYGSFWCASVVGAMMDFNYNVYQVNISSQSIKTYPELIKHSWYEQKDIHYIIVPANETPVETSLRQQSIDLLGEPDWEIVSGTLDLMYYNKDLSDYLLNENTWFNNEKFTVNGFWPFFSDFSKEENVLESNGNGTLMYGPYATILPGTYDIKVEVEYVGDLPQETVVGTIDVFSNSQDLGENSKQIFARDTVIQLNQITISEVIENFEIRVFAQYSGLRVLSAEIEKVS